MILQNFASIFFFVEFRTDFHLFAFQNKQRNESGRVISSTNEAELALTSLENLRNNKQYNLVSGRITEVYSFIANPLHSLRDGPVLIAHLAVDLYPGQPSLNIMK